MAGSLFLVVAQPYSHERSVCLELETSLRPLLGMFPARLEPARCRPLACGYPLPKIIQHALGLVVVNLAGVEMVPNVLKVFANPGRVVHLVVFQIGCEERRAVWGAMPRQVDLVQVPARRSLGQAKVLGTVPLVREIREAECDHTILVSGVNGVLDIIMRGPDTTVYLYR